MAPKKQKHASRRKGRRRALTAACALICLAMVGLGGYVGGWYVRRARTESDNTRYRAMYIPMDDEEESAAVEIAAPALTDVPTHAPTLEPTRAPAAEPTHALTPEPTRWIAAMRPRSVSVVQTREAMTGADTATIAADVTSRPEATPAPEAATPESTLAPAATPEPLPAQAVAVDEPRGTVNPYTLVYALPTVPPVQESFGELIDHNPDTVGFLRIRGLLELPVVQRENDNQYYLERNFDGEKSSAGTLFLDCVNSLSPEDDCLIVYGHNMKNGTMFGNLSRYADPSYMKVYPIVHFDTIYEDRLYAPFAAFTASMEPSDKNYFNIRQFLFDEAEFDAFTLRMKLFDGSDNPVDVRYGDRLLLLVTCEYTHKDGRFILALRQLRPDETPGSIRRLFKQET